jgi:hypothetical protein
MEDDRIYLVQGLLEEHLKSPSLRHIRDGYAVRKLCTQIVRRLDRKGGLWEKWEGHREPLLKAAAATWIPLENLRHHLNRMQGPRLTLTDVEERLRAFHEEPYTPLPNDELREGCLAIYEKEKSDGTEMAAIVGALQAHVEREEERLRLQRQESYRRQQEEARVALEQRFLSGADFKWTPIDRSKELYCRINGRTYRLAPLANKQCRLQRIASPEDQKGIVLGIYGSRGEATKAVEQLAYRPEPRA